MLAKDLKAGQKFTRRGSSHECTAIGITDYCGDVYFTEDLGDGLEVDYLDENASVTLVEEKPASSYADRQAAWVEEHGLKIGSKVKVTRKAEDREDGWPVCWSFSMDSLVGNEYEIVGLDASTGVQLPGAEAIFGKWNLPYFVLEPVKPSVDPGEGYRLLGPDEICQKGDCYFCSMANTWCRVIDGVGSTTSDYQRRYNFVKAVRRKIEPVKPSVDPGEGYRLLEPGEKLLEGDEFVLNDGRWAKSNNWLACIGKQGGDLTYRRKIEPTYRPYTAEEAAAIVGKVVVYKEDARDTAVLIGTNPFGEPLIYVGTVLQSMGDLLEKFTFLDGTPCGVAE